MPVSALSTKVSTGFRPLVEQQLAWKQVDENLHLDCSSIVVSNFVFPKKVQTWLDLTLKGTY